MKKRNKLPISVQLLLEKEDKILLMKRKNTGYEDGKYSLPGGHVKANEEIRKALIREAKEEIGIQIDLQDIELYKVLNRKVNQEQEYVDFVFKANHWEGNITNEETDKCEEVNWFQIEKLPENMAKMEERIIYDYKNNINFDEYGW